MTVYGFLTLYLENMARLPMDKNIETISIILQFYRCNMN